LILLALSIGAAPAGGLPVSRRLAWRLMGEAMTAMGIGPRAFVLVPSTDANAPDFYSFQALPVGPGSEGSIGFFAVNPWSGYVWNKAGCVQVTSPTLKREQERVLKHSGMSAAEAKALGDKLPGCVPE
jgi:hypothetical protein